MAGKNKVPDVDERKKAKNMQTRVKSTKITKKRKDGNNKEPSEEVSKLTEQQYELLREQIRMVNGMPSMKRSTSNTTKARLLPVVESLKRGPRCPPIMNRAAALRIDNARQCKQCRCRPDSTSSSDLEKLKELIEITQKESKKKVKLNFAAKVRWLNSRGKPIFSTFFKDAYMKYGRPPLCITQKYKPFSVIWEADWSKEPYIWEDYEESK